MVRTHAYPINNSEINAKFINMRIFLFLVMVERFVAKSCPEVSMVFARNSSVV